MNDPAFPVPDSAYHGMTLRDYFAVRASMMALQCAITHPDSAKELGLLENNALFEFATAYGYKFADAMLKAREQ